MRRISRKNFAHSVIQNSAIPYLSPARLDLGFINILQYIYISRKDDSYRTVTTTRRIPSILNFLLLQPPLKLVAIIVREISLSLSPSPFKISFQIPGSLESIAISNSRPPPPLLTLQLDVLASRRQRRSRERGKGSSFLDPPDATTRKRAEEEFSFSSRATSTLERGRRRR